MTDLASRLREAKHRLAHFFGVNRGRVETFWLDGDLWTGFRCGGCDQINHATRRDMRATDAWLARQAAILTAKEQAP